MSERVQPTAEQWKQADAGLNVRARVENYYSKEGFSSIFPTDKNGRLRWWGLYTQRKPGVDGGKTALLEDEDLECSCRILCLQALRELEGRNLCDWEGRKYNSIQRAVSLPFQHHPRTHCSSEEDEERSECFIIP